jgi:putative ABC transport system permease protein
LVYFLLIGEILLPLFNETAGTSLSFSRILHPHVLAALAGLVLIVGVAAGGYPSALLTAFKPVFVLKGQTSPGTRGSVMIKALVVFQFAISIFLMIGTFTVFQQLEFMKSRALGFDGQGKIIIPFRYNAGFSENFEAVKKEYLNHPAILGAAASSSVPGRRPDEGYLSETRGGTLPAKKLNSIAVDFDFIPQYKIAMAAGRPFRADTNDAGNAILLNEAAVKFLGYSSPGEALGQRWFLGWYDGRKVSREIVGVTGDFHYRGMQETVEPLFMFYAPFEFNTLTLTLGVGASGETTAFIEDLWQRFNPGFPYEGYILQEDFDRQYRAEERIGRLLGLIAGMGLALSALGLLGLAAFMTRQRTKEIGIRKVLGASVPDIALMFSRTFSGWVLLAGLLAWPSAYYAVNNWLQNFAYRAQISPLLFLAAPAAALLAAFLAVSFHIVRTATADPVESLRYE